MNTLCLYLSGNGCAVAELYHSGFCDGKTFGIYKSAQDSNAKENSSANTKLRFEQVLGAVELDKVPRREQLRPTRFSLWANLLNTHHGECELRLLAHHKISLIFGYFELST